MMHIFMSQSDVSQQEISEASEVVVRKYKEDTLCEDLTPVGVAAAMWSSIKDSIEKHSKKLSKIVSVANLTLGWEWLHEVHVSHY